MEPPKVPNVMANLIGAINKIQDIFNALKVSNYIKLPQIVMLGSQVFIILITVGLNLCPTGLQSLQDSSGLQWRRLQSGLLPTLLYTSAFHNLNSNH